MQQLEIPFFYPLIEQTTLDLDFTPSEQWIAEWRQKQWSTSVTAINGSYPISSGGTDQHGQHHQHLLQHLLL